MNILVYGAGVLGSLYAARLQESGHNVSILARGQRLSDIREHGIVLKDALSRRNGGDQLRGPGPRHDISSVNVVEQLAPEDAYDLVVVLMRKNQVSSILPILAANEHTPNVLFMHNNAAGPAEMIKALGHERVLLGFPGAGGILEGHVIHYLLIKQQPTTLGELDGSITPRLKQIVKVFKDAGFPVAVSRNIDAWLKTHAMFITAIESAIYMAGGNNYWLAYMQDVLLLMIDAIREGFTVLQALGIPITPFKLKVMFEWMPTWFPFIYWQRALDSKLGRLSLSGHANAAPDEIKQLAEEIRALVRTTSVPTPAMDRLYNIHSDD